MQLHGIHHVSAVTATAAANHRYYTRVLGMRLVKKTVNQDDVSAYHLFYADALASPGTDLTFFDFPSPPERRGSDSIVCTALRVAGPAALEYWADRLDSLGIPHGPIVEQDARLHLHFEDPEGQRLALIDDGSTGPAHPWPASPVPPEHQVRGLGPVTISIRDLAPTHRFLTETLLMRPVRTYDFEVAFVPATVQVYAMGDGGPAAELHVRHDPSLAPAHPGAGGVHHVAFRIPDADHDAWVARYQERGIRSSGPVDRFYFRSLYAREPNGILFEIATDGPGFATDEPLETLGQSLALPPFLEPRRQQIEQGLKPLVTVPSAPGGTEPLP